MSGSTLKILVKSACIIIMVITLLIALFYRGKVGSFGDEVKKLTKQKMKIFLLGNPVGIRNGVDVSYLTAIEELIPDDLEPEKNTVLVINDSDDELEISDEQVGYLKNLIYEKYFSLYYIGKRNLEKLSKIPLFPEPEEEIKQDDTNMSFVRIHCPPKPNARPNAKPVIMGILNFWRTTDAELLTEKPEYLGEVLLFSFMNDILHEDTDYLD